MDIRVNHARETLTVIRKRLDSKDWWFWIPVGATGADALRRIERKFYWAEANSDFDLAFFPLRLLFVGMGKKSRCSPQQIQKLINRHSGTKNIEITDRTDVMVLIAEDDKTGMALAMAGLRFLADTQSQVFPDLN